MRQLESQVVATNALMLHALMLIMLLEHATDDGRISAMIVVNSKNEFQPHLSPPNSFFTSPSMMMINIVQ